VSTHSHDNSEYNSYVTNHYNIDDQVEGYVAEVEDFVDEIEDYVSDYYYACILGSKFFL